MSKRTKYIKRNRFTGDFIEWDRIGGRSVSASMPYEVGVRMLASEEAEFIYLELVDQESCIGAGGQYQYEVQHKEM